jgi:hypothetical protein
MNIQEAESYINYCIRKGFADPEDFKHMTPSIKIRWANEATRGADFRYEQTQELWEESL